MAPKKLHTENVRQLGIFETAQIWTNLQAAFNAVIVIGLSPCPEEETLQAIPKILIRYHPLLSSRIEKHNKRYFFAADGIPDVPFRQEKKSGADDWKILCQNEMNTPIDIDHGPLLRISVLKDNDSCEIILTFQHAVIDAASAAGLVEKLLEEMERVESGGVATSDIKPKISPPADALFPSAYKGWEGRIKILRSLFKMAGDEISFRIRSRGMPKPSVVPDTKCRIHTFSIDPDESDALISWSRKRRITPADIFTSAILRAVQHHLYEGRPGALRHFFTSDLRPYLCPPLDSGSPGSYFSMLRMTVPLDSDTDLEALSRRAGRISLSMLKGGEKFIFNLMSRNSMKMVFKMKKTRMGATGLSYTGTLPLKERYGRFSVIFLHAFASNFGLGPQYTAFVRRHRDRFIWDIVYLESDMSPAKVETISAEIRHLLHTEIKEAS